MPAVGDPPWQHREMERMYRSRIGEGKGKGKGGKERDGRGKGCGPTTRVPQRRHWFKTGVFHAVRPALEAKAPGRLGGTTKPIDRPSRWK